MDAIFKEYGEYILAVIATAIVIWCVTGVMGFFDPVPYDGSGTGLLGKLICLWMNRTM